MIANEVMLMIANFLFGNYDPAEFSYDLPEKLVETSEALDKENPALSQLLGSELPEICGFYDLNHTGDRYTYGLDVFREKVAQVYRDALPLAMSKAS